MELDSFDTFGIILIQHHVYVYFVSYFYQMIFFNDIIYSNMKRR